MLSLKVLVYCHWWQSSIKRRGTDVKWMWQSTEKEAVTQVSMEKIEQWEVLEIQTKVYGKSTYRIKQCTEKTMKICLNLVKCITLIQRMLSIRRVRDLDPTVIIHFGRSSSEGVFRSLEFGSMFFKKHINVKSANSEWGVQSSGLKSQRNGYHEKCEVRTVPQLRIRRVQGLWQLDEYEQFINYFLMKCHRDMERVWTLTAWGKMQRLTR